MKKFSVIPTSSKEALVKEIQNLEKKYECPYIQLQLRYHGTLITPCKIPILGAGYLEQVLAEFIRCKPFLLRKGVKTKMRMDSARVKKLQFVLKCENAYDIMGTITKEIRDHLHTLGYNRVRLYTGEIARMSLIKQKKMKEDINQYLGITEDLSHMLSINDYKI